MCLWETTVDLVRRLVSEMDEQVLILLDTSAHFIAWLGGAERVFGYSEQDSGSRAAYTTAT